MIGHCALHRLGWIWLWSVFLCWAEAAARQRDVLSLFLVSLVFESLTTDHRKGRKQGRRQGKEGSDWDLIGCHRQATLHFMSRETKCKTTGRLLFGALVLPFISSYHPELPPPGLPVWPPHYPNSAPPTPIMTVKLHQTMLARGLMQPFFVSFLFNIILLSVF